MSHSQKPSESYHTFISMNAQVSGTTWCTCAPQLSRPSSMSHARHAQQVFADCQQLSNLSRRQKFTHVNGGPRSQVPHSRPQAPPCLKKNSWILFDQAMYIHQSDWLNLNSYSDSYRLKYQECHAWEGAHFLLLRKNRSSWSLDWALIFPYVFQFPSPLLK